ncbi:glycosyltransferase [Carboxylicivirga linearis]|uniref:Glycosyltransferase n=1 Tax=Carboxylicivirga linearis TaxID=1628157 RepID=A0ABS5JR47_9BACT|nr:glycosyltransferase [Carboxylicivirga linearis]MBS2097378.1 glycosyltransferase [Carboxylicivirga linearis]
MRIVIVSPSKEVNEAIANHTYLMADALRMQVGNEIKVIEIHKYKCDDGRNEATTFEHFTSLARTVNESADVCLLQYHSNAYYGYDSRYILGFVNKLNIPLLTFCHSVINDPSHNERSVVLSLASRSLKVFVKSQLSIDFMEHFYKVNPDQLIRLEYGVPAIFDDEKLSKFNDLNIKGKKVLLSTGYLKPENGYETVINALPAILNHYPDFVYVIQGVTSHVEKEIHGEEYRKSLQMQAKSRGVFDKVIFDDRSLSDEELVRMIKEAEIYVNADINEQKLSNDALSLAVGAGSVILSTPTWFAKSFLEDDRGQFFAFKSSSELAQLVVNTMRSKSERSTYKEMTALFGSQFSWENVGTRLLKIIETSVSGETTVDPPKKRVILPELLPEWTPNHLLKMYDGTALLSSCFNDIVDYNKGYSLRENAMGVQVLAMATEGGVEDEILKGSLSFIKYMENEDGSWSKGMEFNRAKKEGFCKFGEARAVWSLGSLFKRSKSAEIRDVAYSLFNKLINQKDEPKEVLSKAAMIIGISHVLEGGFPDEELIEKVKRYANSILKLIPDEIGIKWQWYEERLSNKYGLVPLALAYAHNVTGDNRYLSASRRTCRFIERLLFIDGVFNPAIQGYKKEDVKIVRGNNEQSSDEAFMMVACYAKLYRITREPLYLSQLSKTHLWYLGENNLRKSVYDQKEGGCYQALGQRGVNPHKGTDSTCSYWLSHFTFMDAFFRELEDK